MKDRQDIIRAKVETLLGERGPAGEAAMRQKDADALIERATKRVAMTVGKSAASAAAKASAAADEARDFAIRAERAVKAMEDEQAEYAARMAADLEAQQEADLETEQELEEAVEEPESAHGDMISDRPFLYGDMRGWLNMSDTLSLIEKDTTSTTAAVATCPSRFALRLLPSATVGITEIASFAVRRPSESISASFQYAGQPSTNATVGLVFAFYGADGVLISNGIQSITMTGVTTWATAALPAIAIPAGTVLCRVFARRVGDASIGIAFITNISAILRRTAASVVLESSVGSAQIAANAAALPSFSFAAAGVNVAAAGTTMRQIVNSTDLDAANAPGFTLFSCDLEFTPPSGEILMNAYFAYEVTGGPLSPAISASFGAVTAFSPAGSTALVHVKVAFMLPVTFVPDLPATITITASRDTGFTIQASNRSMAHINYKR